MYRIPSHNRKLFGVVVLGVILLGAIVWKTGVYKPVAREIAWRLQMPIPGMAVCPDCNVVIISLDVLGADELPCYGYFRNTAPNLCTFAQKNNYFTRYYSESSYTMDATFSLITGLLPSTHHMIVAMKDLLNPGIPTLPEMLKKYGYTTVYAGKTDDPNLPLNRGLGKGFDEIHQVDTRSPGRWPEEYAPLLPKLKGTTPVFMFFHNYALHDPYAVGDGPRQYVSGVFPDVPVTEFDQHPYPLSFYQFAREKIASRLQHSSSPESYARSEKILAQLDAALRVNNSTEAHDVIRSLYEFERYQLYDTWFLNRFDTHDTNEVAYLRGLYDEKIHVLDADIKPLLDYLSSPDIKRHTVVIITSPHGEEFMEHGFLQHDNNIYDTVTHVPLIVSLPDIHNGAMNSLAQGIDLFPTVLDMVGITNTPKVDGSSLLHILRGSDMDKTTRYVASEYRGNVIQSVTDGRWKMYIHNDGETIPWEEVYDRIADPGETKNVNGRYPDIQLRLRAALQKILSNSPRYTTVRSDFPDWIDDATRQRIIDTGYF